MIDTTYLFPYDLLILEKYNEYLLLFTYVIELVATGEIESPTRGFSVHCSTNWATRPYIFIIKNDHGMARTFDPRIKSALLYQLSYMIFYIKAPKTGLEPITSVLTAPCSTIELFWNNNQSATGRTRTYTLRREVLYRHTIQPIDQQWQIIKENKGFWPLERSNSVY